MRLIYWNIRQGGGKRASGILHQLLAWNADVIGLSEFRGTKASGWLSAELAKNGFNHQLTTTDPKNPPSNALLLASKFPLTPIPRREQWYQPTLKTRWILAKCDSPTPLTVGLMHIPNYTSEHKAPFMARILKLMKQWKLGPAIIGGDTNCGKMFIDEDGTNPKLFRREHDWMCAIDDIGWVDAFRHLHGNKREWTWYSPRQNGFRLDHAFLEPTLVPQLSKVEHIWGENLTPNDRRHQLSDHAALIIDFQT